MALYGAAQQVSPEQKFLVKIFIDILVSGLILLGTVPIAANFSVAILASMGRPILYRRERPEPDAEPFVLVKFRTMKNATDAVDQSLPDADRLTRDVKCSSSCQPVRSRHSERPFTIGNFY